MTRPPALAQWLIARLIPSHRQEDLLGDLDECFRTHAATDPARARRRYWGDALRLAPFLAASRIAQVVDASTTKTLAWLLTCVASLALWEMTFVRATAWPITAKLLALGDLPGRLTFFTVYGGITAFGIAAVLGGIRRLSTERSRSRAWWAMVGACLSLPSLFHAVRPQPLDSVWMRLAVLLALWGAIALMARPHGPRQSVCLARDR